MVDDRLQGSGRPSPGDPRRTGVVKGLKPNVSILANVGPLEGLETPLKKCCFYFFFFSNLSFCSVKP
ncbi:hypothetical protein L6452_37475 [Arctium lappa]|uniref:Uncharacterized protein n=1 Tax=Arctium lappa TaxID=4217 RepID=A0ACB8Y2F0_ARCLA|nr:hypothetical protein L6452_37475 [Arctium lappa]